MPRLQAFANLGDVKEAGPGVENEAHGVSHVGKDGSNPYRNSISTPAVYRDMDELSNQDATAICVAVLRYGKTGRDFVMPTGELVATLDLTRLRFHDAIRTAANAGWIVTTRDAVKLTATGIHIAKKTFERPDAGTSALKGLVAGVQGQFRGR